MKYAATGLSIPPDNNKSALPFEPTGKPAAPGIFSTIIYVPFSRTSTTNSISGFFI